MELRRYFDLLRRRWPLLLACVVAAVAIGYWSTPRSATYRTSAQIYVGSRSLAQDPTQLYAEPGLNQVVATFAQMIPSPSFAQKAIAATGVDRSVGTVLGETSATVVTNTTLINVSVTDPDPAVAQKLANGISNAFVAQIQAYEPGSAAAPGSVPSEPAYVFQPSSEPGAPLATGAKKHMILGGIFGLIAAILVVFLLDYLDVTVRSPEAVERRLGLPVLGVLPVREGRSVSAFRSNRVRREDGVVQ